MKAVVYTRYGPPDALRVREVERPVPGDDEVLVRVLAAPVTVGDSRMRGFRVPPSFWLPTRLFVGLRGPRRLVLGTGFAGTV